MLSISTRLILVRHGASRSTEIQIVAGHLGCRGLSSEGVLQSERLSRRWLLKPPFDDEHPFGGAYSSMMRRSQETALIALSPLGLTLTATSCGLCEIHPGVTDAMTWKEVAAKFGEFDVFSNPELPIAPGAESWNQMRARVTEFLESLVLMHLGPTILIFTHKGVIDATLEAWLKGSPSDFADGPQNTSLTTWIVEVGEHGKVQPVLASYDDASHLTN